MSDDPRDLDTDPGGHEPFSDPLPEQPSNNYGLPPVQLPGAPAWAQMLFDETRAGRREMRAHVADEDGVREALVALQLRVTALENAALGRRPTPAPGTLRRVDGTGRGPG